MSGSLAQTIGNNLMILIEPGSKFERKWPDVIVQCSSNGWIDQSGQFRLVALIGQSTMWCSYANLKIYRNSGKFIWPFFLIEVALEKLKIKSDEPFLKRLNSGWFHSKFNQLNPKLLIPRYPWILKGHIEFDGHVIEIRKKSLNKNFQKLPLNLTERCP